MIAKLICLFIGHSFFVIASKETEHSVFGYLRCTRCPKTEGFQFDFAR